MSTIKTGSLQGVSSSTKNIELNDDGSITINGGFESASQNGGPLAGFRNQLINGDFRIWQRGTSFAQQGSSRYIADRWSGGGGNQPVVERSDDTANGFDYSLKITGDGTRRAAINQAIELRDDGKAGCFAVGSTWTVSFYAKVNSGSQSIRNICEFADDVFGN